MNKMMKTKKELEKELEIKCNQLIKTSALMGFIILILIIAFLFYVFSEQKDTFEKIYPSSQKGWYYLKCQNNTNICGSLGVCESVTIKNQKIQLNESLCFEKEK